MFAPMNAEALLSRHRGALLVAFVAAAVYGSTLGHAFTWDDGYNVVENESIRSLSEIPGFFLEAWGSHAEDAQSVAINTNYYRPVALASYAVDYALFGLNPTGFHGVNVFLHVLASVLVWLLGWRLCSGVGRERWGALAAAIVFAVHPVHTEVVDVITYRTDLLASLFYLACLVAWMGPVAGRTGAKDRRAVLLWVPLLYALGVGSKEMAVTVPVALALLDWLVTRRDASLGERAKRLAPVVLVLVCYLAVRSALLTPSGYSFYGEAPASVVFWSMLDVFALYGRLLVAPWPLNPFYDWSVLPPQETLLAPGPILGLGLLAAWLGAIRWAWRRQPRVAWLLALYLIVLVPVSHVVPVVVAAGERFLYLAMVGPLLAAGLLGAEWAERPGRVRALGALAAVVIMGATGLTVTRNADWASDRAILEAGVRDWPQSYNHWMGMARLHEREGRPDEAAVIYRKLGRDGDAVRLEGRP